MDTDIVRLIARDIEGLSDGDQIAAKALAALGSWIGADAAGYMMLDVTTGDVLEKSRWGRALADGPWRVRAFGTSVAVLQAASSTLVNDRHHPDGLFGSQDSAYGSDVEAFAVVPVLEQGKVVAFVYVQSAAPQDWTDAELGVAASVAELIRSALADVRSERRQREAHEPQMNIVEAIPTMAWLADEQGMVYWHNRAVFTYAGITEEELDGVGYQKIFHPDDMPAAMEAWYAALAAGTGHESTFRILRADGVYRWFLCRSSPIRNEQGKIVRYVGTTTDIHDQRCAEEELARLNRDLEREVQQRTQERDLIWKTSSDLFTVTTPDLSVFRVNPAWTEMLGWTDSDILSMKAEAFIHPNDRAATFEWLQMLKADGDRSRFENRLMCKNGDHVWISWIITRFDGTNYGTGHNITALRTQSKAQQDLAHASRIAMLGELTASIAHEVSQPLAAIATNANAGKRWLKRPETGLPEVAGALDRISGEARRASEIISRVRSMANRQDTARDRVDIAGLLTESALLLRPQLRTLAVSLDIDTSAALPEVMADRVQIQQVLVNLLLNAGQAMAQAEARERRTRVTTAVEGDLVRISVEDTGPGVPEDVRQRLFDPFFSTKPDGMGIGLSISKSIAEAHGGTLMLDPGCTSGARFLLTLPSL
ncbi:PAS domain-containing protein [Sphingomonas sp. DT-51]|uniref:PAS domain-containing protein n=1 Tax=Sphingomonas sp. DT-51 TaxID=3396165 RepID=UPI003F1C3174